MDTRQPPTLPATDPRAWTAASLDDSAAWYCRLSEPCRASLEEIVQDLRRRPRPATEVDIPERHHAAWAEGLQPVRDALEAGRGFAVVEGIERERYQKDEMLAVYWVVGQALGRPFEQNVQGTLLYDVRDTGQSVSQGARFSVTNAESTFHTDNAFGDVTDYVALLCLSGAKSGGLSQLVSGYSVLGELREKHPAALDILVRPFHVDRRGGVKEGEAPTVPVPIIAWTEGGLLLRYFRYWIEVGQEKVGAPLTAAQVEALDLLDAVAARPELRVEFLLRPGQMLFANNRWTLHNRTAFEDYPEPERRRHYVRLWLERG
jgi:hypothetical protein